MKKWIQAALMYAITCKAFTLMDGQGGVNDAMFNYAKRGNAEGALQLFEDVYGPEGVEQLLKDTSVATTEILVAGSKALVLCPPTELTLNMVFNIFLLAEIGKEAEHEKREAAKEPSRIITS